MTFEDEFPNLDLGEPIAGLALERTGMAGPHGLTDDNEGIAARRSCAKALPQR